MTSSLASSHVRIAGQRVAFQGFRLVEVEAARYPGVVLLGLVCRVEQSEGELRGGGRGGEGTFHRAKERIAPNVCFLLVATTLRIIGHASHTLEA